MCDGQLWGGFASGATTCAECGKRILEGEVEFEFVSVDGRNRTYHRACWYSVDKNKVVA